MTWTEPEPGVYELKYGPITGIIQANFNNWDWAAYLDIQVCDNIKTSAHLGSWINAIADEMIPEWKARIPGIIAEFAERIKQAEMKG